MSKVETERGTDEREVEGSKRRHDELDGVFGVLLDNYKNRTSKSLELSTLKSQFRSIVSGSGRSGVTSVSPTGVSSDVPLVKDRP